MQRTLKVTSTRESGEVERKSEVEQKAGTSPLISLDGGSLWWGHKVDQFMEPSASASDITLSFRTYVKETLPYVINRVLSRS